LRFSCGVCDQAPAGRTSSGAACQAGVPADVARSGSGAVSGLLAATSNAKHQVKQDNSINN